MAISEEEVEAALKAVNKLDWRGSDRQIVRTLLEAADRIRNKRPPLSGRRIGSADDPYDGTHG